MHLSVVGILTPEKNSSPIGIASLCSLLPPTSARVLPPPICQCNRTPPPTPASDVSSLSPFPRPQTQREVCPKRLLGGSKGCLIKGCLNSTEIPKVGIPKQGIPKSGIPKTGIPKVGKTHTGIVKIFSPYSPHPSPSRQTPPAVPPERA